MGGKERVSENQIMKRRINLRSAMLKVLIFGLEQLRFTFVFADKNIYPERKKLTE